MAKRTPTTRPGTAGLLEQEYRLVALDEVALHPDNPKVGDVDGIASSIHDLGF